MWNYIISWLVNNIMVIFFKDTHDARPTPRKQTHTHTHKQLMPVLHFKIYIVLYLTFFKNQFFRFGFVVFPLFGT